LDKYFDGKDEKITYFRVTEEFDKTANKIYLASIIINSIVLFFMFIITLTGHFHLVG